MVRKTTQATSHKRKPTTSLIDSYAAQCWKCLKVRSIESQEDYEEIRSKTLEKFFECKRCEEPGDMVMNFDSLTMRWFQDEHSIPKTPQGLKRVLVVRTNCVKVDVYYESLAPRRKRFKSIKEVATFIEDKEEFKDMTLEEVSFAAPKRLKLKKKPVDSHSSSRNTEEDGVSRDT
ncbi:Methyl-CpG DNA binding [Arabidopsis suecica]|uniref:Methyl-CpG DNA binding n=1 Tax=Arabidopsis suecica TaxID=45249 RepID=A0A8T2E4X1_ARASU|nr:Methyl-CpG DNA binding [Arabidopsis suecica]